MSIGTFVARVWDMNLLNSICTVAMASIFGGCAATDAATSDEDLSSPTEQQAAATRARLNHLQDVLEKSNALDFGQDWPPAFNTYFEESAVNMRKWHEQQFSTFPFESMSVGTIKTISGSRTTYVFDATATDGRKRYFLYDSLEPGTKYARAVGVCFYAPQNGQKLECKTAQEFVMFKL
jgi:hypothetical protein